MSIRWSNDLATIDWSELSELYRVAPLGDKSPADLQLVFGHSLFRAFAFDGTRLVGAGRVLADGRDCAYLCDIAVLPSHRRIGLGKEIVARLLGLSRGHRKNDPLLRAGNGILLRGVRLQADDHGYGDLRGSGRRRRPRLYQR